jgi:hypothetical protein
MSFGLTIKNNNNEFLISDAMRNLHHHTTVTNPSISVPFTNYGGLTRFTYTFTLNSAYIPVPFFTTPFTDRYYAIEKVSQSGNTWTVQLISSAGFPTTTDSGNNPSGSQIVTSLSNVEYQAASANVNTGAPHLTTPSSGDHFISLYAQNQPNFFLQGTSFNGSIGLKIVWDGSVVPLVGADSNGQVTLQVTNGVIPTNFTAGGNEGIVTTDGRGYFPFKSNGTAQPTHVGDGYVVTSVASVPGTGNYNSIATFKVKRQIYTTTGGSSGNSATGSYGSTQIPKLIVFADARAVTGSETHGMTVFKSDGTAAFDNRKSPLIIKQVTAVSHPSNATNNFSGSGLSARNASGPTSTWSTQATPHLFNNITVNTMPNNQMFYYGTVTQRHQQTSQFEIEEECEGLPLPKGGCGGVKRKYYWRSTYWNFYRGGVQRHSNTAIYAGYIPVEFGSYHSRTTQSNFFGVSTGGSSGSSTGKWAWDSAQINAAGTGVNTLIIGDATNYI